MAESTQDFTILAMVDSATDMGTMAAGTATGTTDTMGIADTAEATVGPAGDFAAIVAGIAEVSVVEEEAFVADVELYQTFPDKILPNT